MPTPLESPKDSLNEKPMESNVNIAVNNKGNLIVSKDSNVPEWEEGIFAKTSVSKEDSKTLIDRIRTLIASETAKERNRCIEIIERSKTNSEAFGHGLRETEARTQAIVDIKVASIRSNP